MAKRRAKEAAENPEPIEIELRLTGDPEVLKAVFASSCMAFLPGTEEKLSDLESRYFDTRDLDLRARGMALRVRANGDGFRQTLKMGDDAKAVILRRGEWETPLEDDRPQPQKLPKNARKHMPIAVFKGDLQEMFTTKIRRRARKVALSEAGRVEAALDLGEIKTIAGDLPIAEIELELLEGQPEALYHFALKLQEIGPLHLETRSKSTRAFDRLAGQSPGWHRATNPPLRTANSVDVAMMAIYERCFQQWLANQAAAIDGRDPEGVHQIRVALRRLLSAFSVFRKMIPPEQLTWLQADARQAIGALGPARDWDVFLGDLLAPVIAARLDDPDLQALRSRARGRCRSGYRRARRHLESAEYTRFVLRFGEWLEQRAWRRGDDALLGQPIAEFAGRLLRKRQKQTLAKGKHFADLSVSHRHELRIALKKLRYSAEFFKPLFAKSLTKPYLGQIKALQEGLGHLNDVAVAESLLAELAAHPGKYDITAAAGLVIGWHARGVETVEPDLRRAWKAFSSAAPFWR